MPDRRRLLQLLALASLAALGPAAEAAEVGAPAPALSLLDAQGELVTLDKLRGQVVYVDFWASWCGPCLRSFPFMNDLQARYGSRGLAIVAVNVDRQRADAERFLRQAPAHFRIVFDAAGVTPQAWGVKAMPSSFIVDAAGRIAQVETGFLDERKAAIETRIAALVAAR